MSKCKNCGKAFEKKTALQTYCGKACKKAFNEKKKALKDTKLSTGDIKPVETKKPVTNDTSTMIIEPINLETKQPTNLEEKNTEYIMKGNLKRNGKKFKKGDVIQKDDCDVPFLLENHFI